MDTDLRAFCEALSEDLDWLYSKWSEFQELFGDGSRHLDVLNRAAPNFFYLLQKLLYEDAMLHLCRLTDPAETRVKGNRARNLTVQGIAELISDTTLKAALASAAEQARGKCEFARLWRDKRLAHTDLVINRSGWASALPSVAATDIEEAIDSLFTTLNLIEGYYTRQPVVRKKDPWGAKSLVHYLERGLRAVDKANRE
jgi:hypothetical protein